LGLGDENKRYLPNRLAKKPNKGAKFIKIACGYTHTLLLDNKNRIYSFGRNCYCQLGLGDKNERNLPERLTKKPDEGAKFVKITCGYNYTLLLDNKNRVYSFG